MSKIKICGLRSPDDIRYANELKPDYIGFVFARGRTRYVSFSEAALLRRLLSPAIPAVGVFVDEPLEHVAELLKKGVIQMAQLHGNEDAAYAEALKEMTGAPILKAFTVRSKDDLQAAFSYPCDYPLLDNGKGTGKVFDWSLLGKSAPKPYFLAGGLTVENAPDACRRFAPYAVDVSSGVETDGRKDYTKMKAFIDAVRNLENNE